jgi:hypothetical protein
MDKKTAINTHLKLNYQKANDGLIYFSTLCGAIKDSRKMTGRNIDTGAKDGSNKFGHLGSWLGTMGYITILDQIGKCYRPKSKVQLEKSKSAIIKALSYYTSLNDLEINALYALRNAFFHDFSIYNKDNPKYLHQFIVYNHPTNPVVVLPKSNWDGKFKNISNDNATYVNLQALGDLVENIYKKLIELSDLDDLEIELEGKEFELVSRYSVVTEQKVI